MSPLSKSPLTIEHAVLGFLRRSPTHVYELHRLMRDARELGLVWHVGQSRLYAILERLREAGLVESSTEPQLARPPRHVFALTPHGAEAFARWLRAPVERSRDFRIEFMAKLYFCAADGPVATGRWCRRKSRPRGSGGALGAAAGRGGFLDRRTSGCCSSFASARRAPS